MAESLIENVSDTAFWVAYYRAVEDARPDALFHDRFAHLLVGERGAKIAASMPFPSMTAWLVAIRTTIIDEYIRAAIAQGVDMIVNLGAGLDARPYRMELPPSLQWIEADYPAIIEFKESRLASEIPRCRLERAKIDLGDDDARRSLFAQLNGRATKILALTEGVIPYLTNEQVGRLADDLRSLDHVRYWIAEYQSPQLMEFHERSAIQKSFRNAPLRFKPNDWFGFFTQRGWHAREIRCLADQAKRLRRPLPLPFIAKAAIFVRGLFASKRVRQGFREFSEYILLEPSDIPAAPRIARE